MKLPVFDEIRISKLEKSLQKMKFDVSIPFDEDGQTYLTNDLNDHRKDYFTKDPKKIKQYRQMLVTSIK